MTFLERLRRVEAGDRDPETVFDEGTVSLVAGACGGVPRVLNQVVGTAASLAADAGAKLIDVEAAMEALARLGIESGESESVEDPIVLPHPARMAATPQAAGGKGSKPKAGRKRTA